MEEEKAKNFPFSLSPSDEAYQIITTLKSGKRSEWLREAIVFYAAHLDRRHDVAPALALYDRLADEPVDVALHLYKEGGMAEILERMAGQVESMLESKLSELAAKLAARGMDVSAEVQEMSNPKAAISDLMAQFNSQMDKV